MIVEMPSLISIIVLIKSSETRVAALTLHHTFPGSQCISKARYQIIVSCILLTHTTFFLFRANMWSFSNLWTTCIVLQCLLSNLHLQTAASPILPLKPRLLHQFPNGTWVENIETLSSGKILVTLLSNASLMLLDPHTPLSQPIAVYHENSHTALLGVTQLSPSTLAVVYGNLSASTQKSIPGTFGIELLNLFADGAVSPVASYPMPDASMLDGLTSLPYSDRYLLAADSVLGLIWRLDLFTGAAEKAFASPLLQPAPNTSQAAVNGVHVHGKWVYFTNSNTAIFGRIPITQHGLPLNGSSATGEVLAHDLEKTTYDDFALGPAGSDIFFLSSPTGLSINQFSLKTRNQFILAGSAGDTTFDHPNAAKLGKTARDSSTLYVTTAGIIPGVGGVGGGQVFAVDIK